MKPSKLYIRIFISYLILLIITEIAIFGFFLTFASQRIKDYYKEYGQIKYDVAREVSEYQIRKSNFDVSSQNPAVKEFIEHLGVAFKSKIWITDSDGKVLINSFAENSPKRFLKRWLDDIHNHKSFFRTISKLDIYKSGPIRTNNGQVLTLHLLFDDRPPFRHIDGFGYGLIMIGLIVALVTVPIARRISNPIKTLTISTKKLEMGDLSHRTAVCSKDEIGELASAFNKMAEKLERMVKSGKEMTAQVSHELRSPLARIKIAVEILKDKFPQKQEAETAGQLKTIQTDVDELDHIIGHILELSKLDLQDEVPYAEVFSPSRLLSETLERYEPVLNSKKIMIERNFTSDAKIIGNKEAFSTAINNLMDNTCKYTPTQGKVLLGSLEQNNDVEIILSNSGTSLTTEELEKIFDPFVRMSSNIENGTGLGLSITKKIIEKHRGSITAVNTDFGIEFRIRVPAVRLE